MKSHTAQTATSPKSDTATSTTTLDMSPCRKGSKDQPDLFFLLAQKLLMGSGERGGWRRSAPSPAVTGSRAAVPLALARSGRLSVSHEPSGDRWHFIAWLEVAPFFSFLPAPPFFFFFLCVCVVLVLCLKETERETESKEKGCLPFELLSGASRDWAFAFLSACLASPAALAGLSYKWDCVLDYSWAGSQGLSRG